MIDVDPIRQAIQRAGNVLVITHIGPDGDALGSLTAVGLALRQWNKQYTLACDDGTLSRFSYLALSDEIQKMPDAHVRYDLIVAVDCGDETRMGQSYATLADPKPPILNIDHHITNTQFGDINLVDPQATSTTEILYTLFQVMKLPISREIAMSLLTGLVTDTLGFRTMGVTPRTLKIASDLMDAGADLTLATTYGLSMKPMSTLRLWQVGLDQMRLEEGLLWTTINRTALRSVGLSNPSSSAGLVNLLADVDEVVMSAVLMEMSDGTVRVGFRCRPPYNVSELALNLGGGGHPLAAGCTLDGPLHRAESLVIDLCKQAIRQQSGQYYR